MDHNLSQHFAVLIIVMSCLFMAYESLIDIPMFIMWLGAAILYTGLLLALH